RARSPRALCHTGAPAPRRARLLSRSRSTMHFCIAKSPEPMNAQSIFSVDRQIRWISGGARGMSTYIDPLKALLDNMGEGVYMVAADGRVVAGNRRLAELLDLP